MIELLLWKVKWMLLGLRRSVLITVLPRWERRLQRNIRVLLGI